MPRRDFLLLAASASLERHPLYFLPGRGAERKTFLLPKAHFGSQSVAFPAGQGCYWTSVFDYYYDQKPKEIALAMDMSVKQVDNRLYQTKLKLRESLSN